MGELLFVNACVRAESRTERLARRVLRGMDGAITELRLDAEGIAPLNGEALAERLRLLAEGCLTHPSLRYARQFAEADAVVIAAPYWDLSFPALLKAYIERVCVCGVTFRYSLEGRPLSLCRARRLTYVTTAGGFILEPNTGYQYIRQLAESFFGIPDIQYVRAEGLDILGADVEGTLAEAERRIPRERA